MSIGDTLAESRRQAGLTLTQVSQQTRIRESIIRSIETDDFSPCGGDFYARGHIRSIADVVGVDPVPLVREYDEEHGPPGSMRAAQIFEPATPIRIRDPRPLHLGRVLVVVLLAAVAFGVYHVVAGSGTRPSATAASTVRPVAKPKPKPVVKPAPARPAVPADEAVVRLTAVSDCWVGFDNPTTGQQLSQATVLAGQTATWDEKQPVSIVVGNPAGVEVTVNGKPEAMKAGQVAILHINPLSATAPVTVT